MSKNGLTVQDGGALIRSKLNNLSYALNLKLKGDLTDLRNREVFARIFGVKVFDKHTLELA